MNKRTRMTIAFCIAMTLIIAAIYGIEYASAVGSFSLGLTIVVVLGTIAAICAAWLDLDL